MSLQKPPSLIVVVGVLLLELGACEKLKHGGHNVEGEVNATNQQGVILEWPLVNLKGNDEVIPLNTKPY